VPDEPGIITTKDDYLRASEDLLQNKLSAEQGWSLSTSI
jgi:hypothetical protein